MSALLQQAMGYKAMAQRGAATRGLGLLSQMVRRYERKLLRAFMRATRGNVTQAAARAGRNRTEFYRLLARHGLDPAEFK